MAAQIRGDEKSGTAAQTPSLIAMRTTPGSVVPDGRPTGLDLQDILGPAQRIKSIRSGKEASVDFESSDWNWSDRANGQTDCRRSRGTD
jgi:hypothetical protein